jgi:cob(I)alamin adenosyltransferase
MKIYTGTGDSGETDLFGEGRSAKDAPRVETYGTIDELNAVLGLARTETLPEAVNGLLERVQHELFQVGSELATADPERYGTRTIADEHVRALEAAIDRFQAELAPLEQFILPGGSRAGATLHLARTVSRRAERRLVAAMRQSQQPISSVLLVYLNRLSDLLFVLARRVNAEAGRPDVPRQPPE